jgi:hypothetical protein
MKPRHLKALKALAVFLSFAFTQVYVSAALPALNPAGGVPPQRTVTARLTTRNNQPITVNGNAAGTGATILTGATVETPDQIGATIDLGDAGVVELQPNSKIQLDFDENGNVRVKVIRGCAVTKKKTNVLPGEMELYTDQSSEKTDKKRRHLAGCFLPNGTLGSMGGINGWVLGGLIAGGTGATAAAIAFSRGGTTSSMTPP